MEKVVEYLGWSGHIAIWWLNYHFGLPEVMIRKNSWRS